MAREHVNLVLAFTAAYNAGDFGGAVEDLCAANVTAIPDASIYPESTSQVGRDGLRSILEDSRAAWTSCAHTPKEVLDIGDGRVLIRGDWGGEGTASGLETHRDLSVLYTVHAGQISKVEWFFSHDEALEAAGLSE